MNARSPAPSTRAHVPKHVTITDVSPKTGEAAFVICNEASGRHFRANAAVVRFLTAVNGTGSVGSALRDAEIHPSQATALVDEMKRAGVLVERGSRAGLGDARKGPIEGRLISARFDILDAAPVLRRLDWLGRFAFSWPGALLWLAAIAAMLVLLVDNAEKAALTLGAIRTMTLVDVLAFAAVFLGLKVVHEFGHAVAYRSMCLREGLEPGPIRMGVCIFAFSPFPFTDVTGAWRLRSKWRRALIGAGGIYFESFAVALMAIFWARTGSGTLQTVFLQVAVVSGAMMLLFNLNPLIKRDGYYILSDLLERPNVSGRASLAARQWVGRRLGAGVPAPAAGDLAFWVASYLYRWIIFAGVFWIAYRIDPRLAVPAGLVAAMLLVVRPLQATLGFLRARGVRGSRVVLPGLLAMGVVALAFVPLPDRLLLPGEVQRYETRYVHAPENAVVGTPIPSAALALTNPDLDEEARELALRTAMIEASARSVAASGAEQARVANDVQRLRQMIAELEARIDRLTVPAGAGDVWTPISAERMAGSWVLPGDPEPLGALSTPVPPRLRLWLAENLLEAGLLDTSGGRVVVRAVHDPDCQFEALLVRRLADVLAAEGRFELRAEIDAGAPPCLEELRAGTAVVARLPTARKSLAERARVYASRLLQDRLPIEVQQER